MANNNAELRSVIQAALAAFQKKNLFEAATGLLAILGYRSDRTVNLGDSKPQTFLDFVHDNARSGNFNEAKALAADWQSADLLFQLTDEELSGHASLFKDTGVNAGLLQSYVFFAIELKDGDYARGKLTDIARQINRVFPMPVMVLIKHLSNKTPVISIAVINRRQSKRDAEKDVLGKVTIIRDISLTNPHRGHLDILASFAVPNLAHPQRLPIDNFDTLHAAWEEIFNVELLNKRFYRELANWYFWALPQVEFPADIEKDDEKRRATGLIRLLTRLTFCWFLKEKGLIPENLFVEAELKNILKDLSPDASTYNEGILQNLFFATLNQRMGKDAKGQPFRAFAKDEGFQKYRVTYGVDTLYRYEEHFREPATALDHFADVPFLNGGLFECLDRTEEGTDRKLYLDGFSRNKKKRPTIPNRLFFGGEHEEDLSVAYGDTKRKKEKVRGLLHILHAYKFTIIENTPVDQEIALDPELLGKVFENLLASYNEETKTTARKQTGSFYTPRPIVEYMVDESLKAHLTGALTKAGMSETDAQAGLEILFAYTERAHPFSEREVATLLDAIHTCKILDPACGSGAFPMGMLHKLVYIIHKLDPDNARWMQLQIDAATKIPDLSARSAAIDAIERDFADNEDDYGRKLYLIENCLYGVDIQPIAIQISKLRFFISLVCDQRTNRNKRDNHGIRPLPNLETKFVAADTLISLPEMDQLALLPPRVYQIETEIEALYHSHFAIQRRDQKLAIQKKIKDLREELGKTLAVSLGSSKKAEHIADWDPFNPQAIADFFDPHWMFGRALANNFDIVIGNPPYRVVKDKAEKAKYDKIYIHQDYQRDLYLLFCERAASLLTPNGVVSFITPNTWLYSLTFKKIRRHLRNSYAWRKAFIPKSRVFDAIVDNVVFVFQRGTMLSGYKIPIEILEDEARAIQVDEKYIPKDGDVINLSVTESVHEIYRLIAGRSVRLSDVFDVFNGVKPFEKGKGSPPQSAEIMKTQPYVVEGSRPNGRDWLPLLRGSLIERYKIRWNQDYWIQYGQWLAAPRDRRIFERGQKIYVRQTADCIIAAFVSDLFVARNNLHVLWPKDKSVDVHWTLGVLNSAVTGFVYSYMNPEQGEALAEVKKEHVENLLLPRFVGQKGVISGLVSLLLFNKSRDDEDVSASAFLIDLIDACVMECYFHEHMAERDLLFLDELASHLADYNPDAPESQQYEFIVELHGKLNAPSSKIRNRLLRISADSPDLLAVIKEGGRS
jgi:type I restriction-modification system DNA methylase subunit